MERFYVVGSYEDFKLDIFPSHTSPIIAEQLDGQYRRWAYRIESPYRIVPTHSVGKFYRSPQEMFPYMTYTLSNPVLLRNNSQVVAISKDKLLVEHRTPHLCRKIVFEILKNILNYGYVYRSLLSIKNAIS